MHTKLTVLLAVLVVGVCSTSSASAAPTPTASQVWAKVRAAWTAQAHSHGWAIKCHNPISYPGSDGGHWSVDPKCTSAFGIVGWVDQYGQSNAICRYDVLLYGRTAKAGAKLDVCKPGWLAALPRLDL